MPSETYANTPMQSVTPKLILVMGTTGCGKTSFVNLVSGSNLAVGKGMQSCTETIDMAEFQLSDQKVAILDTPGFDDTKRPQADVLHQIATFLQKTYENGIKPTGIIYMHRISDNRMSGSAIANFRLFRKICGDDAMKNVVIVTTMWTRANEAAGMRREVELRGNYFKKALDGGAKLRRYWGTKEEAMKIVQDLLGCQPQALQVQKEMSDQHKSVSETAAGLDMQSELNRLEKQANESMEKLKAEMDEAQTGLSESERDGVQELQKRWDTLKEEIDKVRIERSRLLDPAVAEDISRKLKDLISRATRLLGALHGRGRIPGAGIISSSTNLAPSPTTPRTDSPSTPVHSFPWIHPNDSQSSPSSRAVNATPHPSSRAAVRSSTGVTVSSDDQHQHVRRNSGAVETGTVPATGAIDPDLTRIAAPCPSTFQSANIEDEQRQTTLGPINGLSKADRTTSMPAMEVPGNKIEQPPPNDIPVKAGETSKPRRRSCFPCCCIM